MDSLASLGEFNTALCDVAPRQFVQIAGERFTPAYNRLLGRYRQWPGVFKVDCALSQPMFIVNAIGGGVHGMCGYGKPSAITAPIGVLNSYAATLLLL